MSELNPRQLRHIRSLSGGIFAVLIVFVSIYCFTPDSFINSSVTTVFTLSISTVSIFIAMYSFTSPEHWYPEDIRHIVLNSDFDDWEFREKDDGEQIIYLADRSVSIETTRISGRMDYYEPWMDAFPKSKGTRYEARILRDSHKYDSCYLIWSDGKMLIPEPTKPQSDTVTKLGHQVGKLIEMGRAEGLAYSPDQAQQRYEDLLDRAGFSIEN